MVLESSRIMTLVAGFYRAKRVDVHGRSVESKAQWYAVSFSKDGQWVLERDA
jgi:hypothetical protein